MRQDILEYLEAAHAFDRANAERVPLRSQGGQATEQLIRQNGEQLWIDAHGKIVKYGTRF